MGRPTVHIQGIDGAPRNWLLTGLPDGTYRQLRSAIEDCPLTTGEVIVEPGAPITHLYFPHDAILSIRQTLRDGRTAAIAMVGVEGALGVGALLGADAGANHYVVQHGGSACRMPVERAAPAFAAGGPFTRRLLRASHVLLAQVAQTAVCNRHHSVDQQLCRWLLMCSDRLPNAVLPGTHELIAASLGVRREGVTAAAGWLQDTGLIRYSRGNITVLNRRGLEDNACECYRILREGFARLLLPESSLPPA